MVMAQQGAKLAFDITAWSGLHWSNTGSEEHGRPAFREHWKTIRNRPPLVPMEPLPAQRRDLALTNVRDTNAGQHAGRRPNELPSA